VEAIIRVGGKASALYPDTHVESAARRVERTKLHKLENI